MSVEKNIFVCAAHHKPRRCCAIDYMIHNCDQATSILNNNKLYSSRISINQDSVKNFPLLVRRLYRLFSHGYFHHREVFLEFESETFLCARFVEYAKKYGLMDKESYTIPEQALQMGQYE